MKAKFYFLSFFVLFVSIKSFAVTGFSGIWTGWGEWTFDGSGTSCQRVRVIFEENDQALKRVSGFWDCDFVFYGSEFPHSEQGRWSASGGR